MAWEYKREESNNYAALPEGKYRVRIASAEKAQSKAGNDMIVLKLDISGDNRMLFHYIVFMPDNKELTNRKLTEVFDSFKDIPDGDFDLSKWVGKVGACVVKHQDYNGEPSAKVSYFIKADRQGDLPGWVEPGRMAKDAGDADFKPIEGDPKDLPFF